MRALVVYESMFGNTELIAREIGAGLSAYMDVDVREAVMAPRPQPGTYDVIVVGGPTHGFAMSTKRSRRDAWLRGAGAGVMCTGMREWLDELPPPHAGVTAAFDTRVAAVRHLPGSAARAATRVLRKRGSANVAKPRSFYVGKEKGPLLPGEFAKARSWGAALALLAGAAPPATSVPMQATGRAPQPTARRTR
jgi:hypothetical protein